MYWENGSLEQDDLLIYIFIFVLFHFPYSYNFNNQLIKNDI